MIHCLNGILHHESVCLCVIHLIVLALLLQLIFGLHLMVKLLLQLIKLFLQLIDGQKRKILLPNDYFHLLSTLTLAC